MTNKEMLLTIDSGSNFPRDHFNGYLYCNISANIL